jgi:hypothetical protein
VPPPTSLVTLAEARTHLNFAAADTSHDTELQGFIDAATPVVEDVVGNVTGTTYTAEEYDPKGHSFIVLRHLPVSSVTTVTEYWANTAYTLTQVASPNLGVAYSYTLDLGSGRIVRRDSAAGTRPFPMGDGAVQVTYVAGRATVPANIRLAALELIRHLYQLTQQGGRPAFGGGAAEEGPWAPSGFAVPTRVLELLAPHQRPPGMA